MAFLVHISGIVQGVGFRPHIYKRAIAGGLSGWVRNDPQGVTVYLEVGVDSIDSSVAWLLADLPPAARVAGVSFSEVDAERVSGFSILDSANSGTASVEISVDLASCPDCLSEMRDPSDRRFRYPYINCTNCGPRYSVIERLPYDRANTTMAGWPMCDSCRLEYQDPQNRRFHAEPTACWDCGPNVGFRTNSGGDGFSGVLARGVDALAMTVHALRVGQIVAIKGLGGYHLACDAANPEAVRLLRNRKFRKEKAFAVMVAGLAQVSKVAASDDKSDELISSESAPIVLLQKKSEFIGVAPDTELVGVMLANTPIQHLLFDMGCPEVLVMTSGNRSSEPIYKDEQEALLNLAGIADAFLEGERPIARRLDDSVLVCNSLGRSFFRRSRGYAPSFVARLEYDGEILACGADLKSSVTLVSGSNVVSSPYLGDLAYYDVQQAHESAVKDLFDMYRVSSEKLQICADMHPGYFSTQLAEKYCEEFGAQEVYLVQHHRAHIASALLEKGLLDTEVVGIAFDGTGYGDDSSIWGGEFFVGSVAKGFDRVSSLEPFLLLGGEASARRPLQALAGIVEDDSWSLLTSRIFDFDMDLLSRISSLREAKGFAIKSTSAGRVFDAFAAICGFVGEMSFEGQAAMWLEAKARDCLGRLSSLQASRLAGYEFPLSFGVILTRPALLMAIQDRIAGVEPGLISLKFHRGLSEAISANTVRLASEHSLAAAVVSGGVFMNQTLLGLVTDSLISEGLPVVRNTRVSCNDEGISLGQAAICAFAGKG
ncbi:MAG: carbamoyltransferase HypF [Acidimicrobiaceae bacterium]|nr:carbamoyltransferase HypF [Acidimicrobiaceae bacterium]